MQSDGIMTTHPLHFQSGLKAYLTSMNKKSATIMMNPDGMYVWFKCAVRPDVKCRGCAVMIA